jgi:N-methylhydantoinase A
VANAEMGRALRVISVERGLDPREFALVAFGGAGGLHACALAEELGIPALLVPRAGGVLSALGLAMSDVRRDAVRPLLGGAGAEECFSAMEEQARADMDDPQLRRRADLRYRGQSFELTVEADDIDAVEERFGEAHERRYGYRMEGEAIELVNARLIATEPVERPELAEAEPDGEADAGTRRANFDGDWQEVPVLRRAGMGEGFEVQGPAIVEFAEATCVVRPGWSGAIDGSGTLVLEHDG